MHRLINIDNGGTLTDICAWDGTEVAFTKTLTTPFDLSQCLFDGLTKVSAEVYGATDLAALLHSTRHIRYSTTQGTNALVERKGPRIGLIVDDAEVAKLLRETETQAALFDDLIGERVAVVDLGLDDDALDAALTAQVNALTTDGAARIVVAAGDGQDGAEHRIRRILLRRFPRHLLGSVPILYSWELSADRSADRRIWSGIVNSFLHPTMERFLYNAEDRLRENKVQNPLLIYRNDGGSSRVAKSVALKTYSSGPRGGLEGTRALAQAYDLGRVLMIDVGGTTTDIGVVSGSEILTDRRGWVAGVPVSIPMSNVTSAGIGGSSIIAERNGHITVGPDSVGAAPGPACFGFGGTRATITDVNLLLGVLDPGTYLDGGLVLDADRSRAVIAATVAEPLDLELEEALVEMEAAYFASMADALREAVGPHGAGTTIAAFGGAGPMSACGAARLVGVGTVLVPRLAAVFSAFGIGFSDITQTHETSLTASDAQAVRAAHDAMLARAERDMFQEGFELDECELSWSIVVESADYEPIRELGYTVGHTPDLGEGEFATLTLLVRRRLPHFDAAREAAPAATSAQASGTRAVRATADLVEDVPVYVLDDLAPGATAQGPAIVEGPFFTARVLAGWKFDVTAAGDLLLRDTTATN